MGINPHHSPFLPLWLACRSTSSGPEQVERSLPKAACLPQRSIVALPG